MLKVEDLRVFLSERPILSLRGLCLESGLSESLLSKIMNGNRKMTVNVSSKLLPILYKYGFK